MSQPRLLDGMLEALAARIRAAGRITILTGAGVSAASGVPTFRGPGGLWRNVRPEDLATPEAFERDPRLAWEWYDWRRQRIASCQPNVAHQVIARWSAGPPEGLPHVPEGGSHVPEGGPRARVVTQNVDDLHLRAGTQGLVRLHGSIWEMRCGGEDAGPKNRTRSMARSSCASGGAAWRDERAPLPELPPRCGSCGGPARPAVVWFGELLAPDVITAAIQACQCDVFLTVGTSAVVHPAAGLVHEAARQGAFTVEINAEPTPVSSAVDLAIQGAAEDILPRLDERL